MSLLSAPYVSDSMIIAAPAGAIFDLLADPHRHTEIDGSGTVRGTVVGPDRLSKGATFGMDMRMLVRYQITNTVLTFEKDREISWRHVGRHVWRYQLEPVDDTHTRVTESWDCTDYAPPARVGLRLLGFPRRTRRAVAATLLRLKAATER